MRALTTLLTLGLAVALTAGCAGPGSAGPGAGGSSERLEVVTSFYPLQFLTERIGGDAVTVTNVTKPGAEPHDLELNPRQVGKISDAGLVVYLSGFQPAMDEAVAQEASGKAFDAASAVPLLSLTGDRDEGHIEPGHQHTESSHGRDPHLWLDPVRFAAVADRLAARMSLADPKHATGYATRGRTLRAELDALNSEYAQRLRSCPRRELVTSHTAFAYLAERYGLTQVGIAGINPETEPSPRRLARVAAEAKATGTTTIFFETLVSPKVAETIAREVGARTAVLDPLEGLTTPSADYFSVMRANLAVLTEALGCT